jgi:ADP-heptose:LPS heptosyltransferase
MSGTVNLVWNKISQRWSRERSHDFSEAEDHLRALGRRPYVVAYNLNNHPRSVLSAHLLSGRVVGAGAQGPLNPTLPPWVDYLRYVAGDRGANRIHLADAFCGVCGVSPPPMVPILNAHDVELASDLAQVLNEPSLMKIGIVLGAGDPDRRVPLAAWREMIEACGDHLPNSLCVLIGGAGEREAALALEDQLPLHYLSRVFNCVGRTSLPQLAHVFNRCQWVVGSDTGPLHLGVACGARAIGWYFSRARVHETGPYGEGHFVWQYQGSRHSEEKRIPMSTPRSEPPRIWPVMETIDLIRNHHPAGSTDWALWTSHRDEWGMFYTNGVKPDNEVLQRKEVWEQLSSLQRQDSVKNVPAQMR